MKKLLIALIGVITLSTTLPALAGPDWQASGHARKAKQEARVANPGDPRGPTATGPLQCPPDAPVLLLDHGPRAQAAPYQNRLRKERFEAQVKACAHAPK